MSPGAKLKRATYMQGIIKLVVMCKSKAIASWSEI